MESFHLLCRQVKACYKQSKCKRTYCRVFCEIAVYFTFEVYLYHVRRILSQIMYTELSTIFLSKFRKETFQTQVFVQVKKIQIFLWKKVCGENMHLLLHN